MCARNVRELTSCASAMNVWLRLAATGLRYTDGEPLPSNVPRPTPSGCVSLNATRLVGASSSQNVACTSFGPPLIPNSRHMARDSMCNRGLRRRGALRRLLDSCARGDCVRTRGAARPRPAGGKRRSAGPVGGVATGEDRRTAAGSCRLDGVQRAVRDHRVPGDARAAARRRVRERLGSPSLVHPRAVQLGWPLVPHARRPRVSDARLARADDARLLPAVPGADVGGVARVGGPGRPLRDPVVDNRRHHPGGDRRARRPPCSSSGSPRAGGASGQAGRQC